MLKEKVRDIVLLVTLAGVAFLTLRSSECACGDSISHMRGSMERRLKASPRATQGAHGARRGWTEARGDKAPKRGKKKGEGRGANIPQYPSSSK